MRKINMTVVDMLRARKCMTSRELAQNAGISIVTLNKAYNSAVSLVVIGKVAKALNVDVTEIIIPE